MKIFFSSLVSIRNWDLFLMGETIHRASVTQALKLTPTLTETEKQKSETQLVLVYLFLYFVFVLWTDTHAYTLASHGTHLVTIPLKWESSRVDKTMGLLIEIDEKRNVRWKEERSNTCNNVQCTRNGYLFLFLTTQYNFFRRRGQWNDVNEPTRKSQLTRL